MNTNSYLKIREKDRKTEGQKDRKTKRKEDIEKNRQRETEIERVTLRDRETERAIEE